MNERIKKLKEQATSYTWNGNDVTEELDEQKFAELIVAECMGLVDGYTYPVQTQSHTIYHIASDTIKEHFGEEK